MTSPNDPQAKVYSHINGNESEVLTRLAVSELCKGWPVYRDASEWKNFRSLFCNDAYVWTSKKLLTSNNQPYRGTRANQIHLAWSKRQSIDGFIQKSKEGKSNGDFIMHRECGTLVELNPSTSRAVGKMKATITQRFRIGGDDAMGIDPIVFDVDCDSRFHFFCFRDSCTSAWKVKYVKLIYEKDKIVPVDGKTPPSFTKEALDRYPEGYKYLGAAQSMLGHDIDVSLPTIQGPELGPANTMWLDLYDKMGQWLDGAEDIDLSTTPGHSGTDGKVMRNGH
ncbi:hypothetical protein F5Y13DRAFT_90437 [Hypoxylon sp. FL1857]|nr:hypothetical protein F5Y13DRAFT_90437 [Hypoxylon sp. FL1857]